MAPRVAVGGRCGSSGPGLAARDNAAEAARASNVAGSGFSAPAPAARDRHPLPAVRSAGPLAPALPGSRRTGDAGWRRHKGRRGGDCKVGRQLGPPGTVCRDGASAECGCSGGYPLPASGRYTTRPAPRHPEPPLHLRPARLQLPRPPALRGGVCRRRPITRRMQIRGGPKARTFLVSWSGNCWINPLSCFSSTSDFYLCPSGIILFACCLSFWLFWEQESV